MYQRAKTPALNNGQDIQFYSFHEWIQKDIASTLFTREANPLKLSTISFANRAAGEPSVDASQKKFGPPGGVPPPRRSSMATTGLTGLKPSSTGLKVGGTSDKMKTMLGRGLKLNDVSKLNVS